MKTGIIVQMRLDSSRLPRKALLPLGSGTLASMVMHRLRRLNVDEHVLACDGDSIGMLGEIAARCGFKTFTGSKDDVLDRYIKAAEQFHIERIIRATGDNPLVSTELAGQLMSSIEALEKESGSTVDYAGHTGMPIGMGVELVRLSALRKAAKESIDPYDHEHVCPYLYRNPDSFRVERLACPAGYGFAQTRLTIDTPKDYQMMQAVFADLGPEPSDAGIMAYLQTSRTGTTDV